MNGRPPSSRAEEIPKGVNTEVTATVAAVCTLLVRQCLGASRLPDVDAARGLCRHLVKIGAPDVIVAVATVGVWAAYPPHRASGDDLDDDVLREVAEVARLMMDADADDGMKLLAAVTLIMIVHRDRSDSPAHDLVVAAQALWTLEHHDLAVVACRRALDAPASLAPLDEATALTIVARITRDPDDAQRLRWASRTWPVDVAARIDVRNLLVRSEPRDDHALDAFVRGDRTTAARLMAETTADLIEQSTQDHDFLDGLRRGFLAMSELSIDVENLRLGLIEVVRQVRSRQRFGHIPPAARSGLELLILLISSDENEARSSVLAELLEALADAGLSEIDLPASDGLPQVAEAALAEQARHFPLWPDLRACADGLGGNFGLLIRGTGGGAAATRRWLSIFIVPPGGALLTSEPITAGGIAVLERLNPVHGPVTDLTQLELDELVSTFLHSKAVEMLTTEPTRGLVVVPDGPLWRVPWQAASLLRTRPTTIAPSLTVYSVLKQPPARIRSVAALIDPAIRDAEQVTTALDAAHRQGALDVSFGVSALDRECDLLLVIGHGTGDGLSFQLGIDGGLTAHDLARRSRARCALVACCGSAKMPPVALPINLSVSLLVRGCTHCVGGMWLLPQARTSHLVATTINHIAAGQSLVDALAQARGGSSDLCGDWGLASAGSIKPWAG